MGMEPVALPVSAAATPDRKKPQQHEQKLPSPDNGVVSKGGPNNRKKTPSSSPQAGKHSVSTAPSPSPARSPAPPVTPSPAPALTPTSPAPASPAPVIIRSSSASIKGRKLGRRTSFKKSASIKSRKENGETPSPSSNGVNKKDENGHGNGNGNKAVRKSVSSDEEEEGRLKQGPWLLKLAKTYHAQGDNPTKAFQFASRAVQCFEKSAAGRSSLDMVVSLHILAALQCRQGHFEEAVSLLKRALSVPDSSEDAAIEHTLATFAGHMQLGDTLVLQGKHQLALYEYQSALKLQKQALGELDIRVAETCRYVAEAHLQALQFDEAGELCELALKIHKEKGESGSIEEAADRRLMAMVCSGKGDHEEALEHLVVSSTVFLANGLESDVAAVDSSIGDALFALGRDTEAALAYQKSLTVFKSTKGETHALVAAVYVRLAELSMKTGKPREAKTYCENALRIFGTQGAGHALEDIVYGLADIAGIYELLGEREQAVALLSRAVDIQDSAPGQTFTTAGVEAQLGILYCMTDKFQQAYTPLKNAVENFKCALDGKNTLFLGLLLNQLGLTAAELGEIEEAKGVLEESRTVMESAVGLTHPDTLYVCSNLAGTYDALGRTREAIILLESVLEIKENKIGSVHPEVEEENKRLQQLLRDVGLTRTRKSNTLKELLHMAIEESARR
ncbi:unnamed protein product [Calypogeia fissa]